MWISEIEKTYVSSVHRVIYVCNFLVVSESSLMSNESIRKNSVESTPKPSEMMQHTSETLKQVRQADRQTDIDFI